MIWGIDISDYQPDFDLHRARREGFDFVIIKSTEGSTWRGKWFRTHLDRARNAGLLTAAYHYVRSTDVAGQVRNIQSVVPRDCPLILDVEEGAGPLSVTWDLFNRLRAAGYRLPLLYLPKWWADKIGATNLRGFPPLWYSRYANNQGGYAAEIWNRAGGWFDQFWGGYYGLHVEIMQFSDKATVAGRTPIDVNAYRGTREQLAALLGGGAISSPGGIESMGFNDKYRDWAGNEQTVLAWMDRVDRRTNVDLPNAIGSLTELVRKYTADQSFTVQLPAHPSVMTETVALPPKNGYVTGNQGQVFVSLVSGEDAEVEEVYFTEDWTPDGKPGKKTSVQGRYTLKANDRQSFAVPGYATQVSVRYSSKATLSVGVEVDAKWK